MKTILYSDDVNLICYWEKSLNYDCIIVDDIQKLKKIESSFIIMNYCICSSTCKDLIADLNKLGNSVMVMHRVPDIKTAKELLKSGAKGYGNALMSEHYIISAKQTIQEGMVWLHPEFTTQLIIEIPTIESNKQKEQLEKLTQREAEVALLLKDGDTYKSIADKLNITPRTIKAHAQSIYSKLNTKDRLALALLLR